MAPYETLAELAECILAGAPPTGESRADFAARCVARLSALPDSKRREFMLAVRSLGSRAAVFVALGRATRFGALDPQSQQRCMAAWGRSSLPQFRSAHQAIRRLVLCVHYAHPAAAAAIGYAGPLHLRTPEVAWEGALDGTTRDDEPVARSVPVPTMPSVRVAPRGVVRGAGLAADMHRRADAVVIGTGAGGAVTAARLAESGYDVVLLEEGSYYDAAQFTAKEAELTEALYADGALRTTDDLSVAMVQGRTVGGSTTVNWMIMLRTPDYVLDEWAREHGVEGMRPHEMEPVFTHLESTLHSRTVPDDAHSPSNRIILDGARALGWHAGAAAINAQGCLRCGMCGVGCRHDAKQSTLVTYVPRALAHGATLYADATVVRIEQRERDQGATNASTPPLKRVHARVRADDTGRTHSLTIDAPLVVVAAGAIGTPVLLQRSGFGGGGVGDWLRLHPTTAVTGVYDRPMLSSTGIPLSAMCDEFIRYDGTDYGFWIECPPMQPSFAAAALPGFGIEHASRMRALRNTGVLIALTRDGADRSHSSGRVRAGRNGVSIRYRLSAVDGQRVRASMAAAARLHFAAGATRVDTLHTDPLTMRSQRDIAHVDHSSLAPNRLGLFSAHVNGTCRMGTDPGRSGATPDGQRHGVRGLYITDGSLLPTALGVNPQETIMAVASVLSDRLAVRHAGITRG